MNLLDVAAILFILGVSYVGYRRGLVGELSDILVLIAAPLFAFFLFGKIGSAIAGMLGTDHILIYIIIWVAAFVPAGYGLFYMCNKLDEPSRKKLPESLWRGAGGILGGIEGFLLLFILLLLFNFTGPQSFISRSVSRSSVLKAVRSFNQPVEKTITGLSPEKFKKPISDFMLESWVK